MASIAGALLAYGCTDRPASTAPGTRAASVLAAATGSKTPNDFPSRQRAIAEAFAARDVKPLSSLYAEDAVVRTWGLSDAKGRAAIEASATRTLAAFRDVKISTGRIWIKDSHTALVESVFAATNVGPFVELGIVSATNRPIGVLRATMFEVGDDGLIREERCYFDVPTILGQLAPPDPQNPVRPVTTSPPNGTEVTVWRGAPEEAAQVEAQRTYVAALDAGKLDNVMKLIAPDFVSDDYVSPDALKGAAGLRELLAGTVKAFPDFGGKVVSAFGAGPFGVFEMEFTGTQAGPTGAGKPSNRWLDAHEVQVNQFLDGKMFRSWSWSDSIETMRALGMPLPTVPADTKGALVAPAR